MADHNMETFLCSICREEKDECLCSLRCDHSFHAECLRKYLKQIKGSVFSCPNCRDEQRKPRSINEFIKYLHHNNIDKCLSCKKPVHVENIHYKHDGCTLDLSPENQTKLVSTFEREMSRQEEGYKDYCLWANEQKRANQDSVKNYASDLISQIIEWKKNYCNAIEMYFKKDLEDLEKSNTYFKRWMEDKKLSIPKSTAAVEIQNVVLPTHARVDFVGRRKESIDLPGFNQRNILASILPSTIDLSKAMKKFKDPSEILKFPEKTEEKTSVDVQRSVYSEMESASEIETASAVDTGSGYECISDFEVMSGKICRANLLPNDAILVCCEDPNKLEMYDLSGSLLSETKLKDIPEDMTLWEDNKLIVCYQNSSFGLVTFEDDEFNTPEEVLKTPRSYDSISVLKPGYMLGKYDRNRCDILKIENRQFKTIKTCYFGLLNVRMVRGNDKYILYSGCNDGLMPTQLNCFDHKTKEDLCMFPTNLSSENIRDFRVYASLLFILDFRCHKVYVVDRSAKTSSVLLSEVDGIHNPFCVDINDSEHLLVCYNNMKQAKLKVFNIKQAAPALSQ